MKKKKKSIGSRLRLSPVFAPGRNPDNTRILGKKAVKSIGNLGKNRYDASDDTLQTALDLEPYKETMADYLFDNRITLNDRNDIFEVATRFAALEFGNKLPISSDSVNYLLDTWQNPDLENLDQNGKNILNSIFGAIGGAFNGFVGAAQSTPTADLSPFQSSVLAANQQVNQQIGTYAGQKAEGILGRIALPMVIILVVIIVIYGVYKLTKK